jgi:RNA polymerase sigma-70 factor (ECF subfamily)
MQETPASLLERLRQPGAQDAWTRFVRLYTPLFFYWARRGGLQESDAADLVQDVFTILVRKLPEFTYDPQRSFRGWLRTVLLHCWQRRRRRPLPRSLGDGATALPLLSVPDGADVLAETEYRQYLIERVLALVQTDFQPATWKAFWECAVVGRRAEEVAADLGLSTAAVYTAKSRVLARLRQELKDLWE